MKKLMVLLSNLVGVSLTFSSAFAITQDAWLEAEWEIENAKFTAPFHFQIAIERFELQEPLLKKGNLNGREIEIRLDGDPHSCVIFGHIKRTFRGSVAVGAPAEIKTECLTQAPRGQGVAFGFHVKTLDNAKYLEAYLAEDGQTIAGHAGWVVSDISDQPQHPAPTTAPRRPSTGNTAKNPAGRIKGGTAIRSISKSNLD